MNNTEGKRLKSGVVQNDDRTCFEGISVRGRVAYAICCLEHALLRSGHRTEEWKWILDLLWNYTSTNDFAQWHYDVAECIPRVISSHEDFCSKDFEFLNSERFSDLRGLYDKCDPFLRQMVDCIFDIGTVELYGGLANRGAHTLIELEKLLDIMNSHGFKLPEISIFEHLVFQVDGGWGAKFDSKIFRERPSDNSSSK